MKRFTTAISFSLLMLTISPAQQNFFPILGGQRAGTSIFTFLKIGVSARAVGMGEAVIALNQDATALYYNPAAVAQLKKTQLSAARVQWPAEIYYDFMGISRRLSGRHFVGFSMGILHMSPMEETTELMPHGTGNYFVYQDRFLALTYSTSLSDRFSFGITFKQVSENLAGNLMQTVMMDLGTFYWTGYKTLRFSAVLSHFGPNAKPEGTYIRRVLDHETGEESEIKSDFEAFSPPTVFRVGTAMDVIEGKHHRLSLAGQLNHPVDNAENISLGAEYWLLNTLAFRGGYKLNKEEENFSLGLGLYLPTGPFQLRVDYSYTNQTHLTNPARLSLGLVF
ncbi:MAG: PorV/PorQ family protein [Fidelibacterota bacterium]